ncbi:hypothetical protein KJ903_04255 [Patescibacteria group bacterium]|nr:hypothetical protein [Patescibacteria group bacterium]
MFREGQPGQEDQHFSARESSDQVIPAGEHDVTMTEEAEASGESGKPGQGRGRQPQEIKSGLMRTVRDDMHDVDDANIIDLSVERRRREAETPVDGRAVNKDPLEYLQDRVAEAEGDDLKELLIVIKAWQEGDIESTREYFAAEQKRAEREMSELEREKSRAYNVAGTSKLERRLMELARERGEATNEAEGEDIERRIHRLNSVLEGMVREKGTQDLVEYPDRLAEYQHLMRRLDEQESNPGRYDESWIKKTRWKFAEEGFEGLLAVRDKMKTLEIRMAELESARSNLEEQTAEADIAETG